MALNYLQNKMARILSSSLHVENLMLKKDIALLEMKKEMEKSLIQAEANKALLETEKSLIQAEANKVLLEAEANNKLLKIQINEQNWDLLKVHQQLHSRTFMVLFRNRHIQSQPGEKFEPKLTNFLDDRKESLKDWGFNEKLFVESLTKFYSSLNENTHPEFSFQDCVDIPVNMFSRREFQVIGFLWENWSLPLKKFKIRYSQTGPVSIETLKKRKN